MQRLLEQNHKLNLNSEIETAKVHHELSVTVTGEVTSERVKVKLSTEQNAILKELMVVRHPLEEEAQRVENRTYGIIEENAPASVGKQFLKFRKTFTAVISDGIGLALE